MKAGTIVAPFQTFEQVQVPELPIESATSKFSAVKSSSINVGLQSANAPQQEDSSLQQKACFNNDMPTHLKQLLEGVTQVCEDES